MSCLVLLPLGAYGTLTVTDRGTGGNNTAGQSSTAMSPGSTIAAGSAGVLCIAADNANAAATNMPTDITDSVGNSWHRWYDAGPGGANTGAELVMYVCSKLTTQLTSGDNVTVTYTNATVTAKCWTFNEIAPSAGNVVLPVERKTITTGTAQTSITVTSDSYLSIGNAIIGMSGAESADTFTGDSDTSNGSWSAQQHTGVGSGATGMSITTQAKVQTTAVSQQTYNVTLTAADTSITEMVFREADSATRALTAIPVTSNNTWIPVISRNLAVGSMGVLCGSTKNYGSGGAVKTWPSSITDSVGNVWTQRLSAFYDPAGAGAGQEVAIYTAPITTALTVSDSMTITWDGGVLPSDHFYCIYEFTPSAGNTFSYQTSGSGTAANSASPTVTTGSLNSGDIVIGLLSAEGTDTFVADADSSNGSWSFMQNGTSGTSATASTALSSQYKTTTGSGTQTYNPTLTAVDLVIGYATIRQATNASATNAFFQW